MSTNRLRHFSSVDLPDPEDPMRHTTSCGSTFRSTSRSTTLSSNALTTLRSSTFAGCHAAPTAWRRRLSRSVYQSVKRATGTLTSRKSTVAAM